MVVVGNHRAAIELRVILRASKLIAAYLHLDRLTYPASNGAGIVDLAERSGYIGRRCNYAVHLAHIESVLAVIDDVRLGICDNRPTYLSGGIGMRHYGV